MAIADAARAEVTQHRQDAPRGAIRSRPVLARYGFAVGCLLCSFLIRYALTPQIHERNPYTFFVPAVLLASWYGGWMPGMLVLVGGYLLGDYFFTGSRPGFGPYDWPELILAVVYLLISGCGIVLINQLHRAHREALASAERAVHYGEQLEMEVAARQHAEEVAREAEQKIREHADELERLVAERTATLQQSVDSLEGLLYHVAHDLRAPLRAMQGFTTILRTQRGSLSEQEIREFQERISTAAVRMDELINDLLHFGQMAQRRPVLAPVNPQRCVEVVLTAIAPEIRESQAEVNVESPMPEVICDRAILIEVLECLMSNALKFVTPGAAPKIRIYTTATEQHVRLCVADQGIGIPPEFRDRIFRVFERLDPAHPKGGTGIGLAIAAKGVERMKATIGVDSEVGKGSCFWIDLPKAREPASLAA